MTLLVEELETAVVQSKMNIEVPRDFPVEKNGIDRYTKHAKLLAEGFRVGCVPGVDRKTVADFQKDDTLLYAGFMGGFVINNVYYNHNNFIVYKTRERKNAAMSLSVANQFDAHETGMRCIADYQSMQVFFPRLPQSATVTNSVFVFGFCRRVYHPKGGYYEITYTAGNIVGDGRCDPDRFNDEGLQLSAYRPVKAVRNLAPSMATPLSTVIDTGKPCSQESTAFLPQGTVIANARNAVGPAIVQQYGELGMHDFDICTSGGRCLLPVEGALILWKKGSVQFQ